MISFEACEGVVEQMESVGESMLVSSSEPTHGDLCRERSWWDRPRRDDGGARSPDSSLSMSMKSDVLFSMSSTAGVDDLDASIGETRVSIST